MTDTNLILSLTADRLQELLQSMGYRVTTSEQNGLVQLLSATQGIGFAVRFGNPAQQAGEYVDYTMSCALRVQGELPAGLAESWNIGKRFARLARQGAFLVLEMDVVAAGGVSENHLRAMTELWDRLLQEFLLFLRQFASQAAAAAQAAADGAGQVAPDAGADKALSATGDVSGAVTAAAAADADDAADAADGAGDTSAQAQPGQGKSEARRAGKAA